MAPAWRRIKTTLWWLLAAVFVLFALWVMVARHLMTTVDEYREPLAVLFEEKARTPMNIGALSGRLDGLNPHFELQDVRLYARDDSAETLRLEQVDITIDLLQSLLHRELRIRYLRLQGLDVQMEMTRDGNIEFAGIQAIGSTHDVPRTPLERVLDIAYRQRHIELADTALTLITPDRPVLRFENLQGLWVKRSEGFRFAFQAAEQQQRLQLEARLHVRNRAYRWTDLQAEGYLRAHFQQMEPWLLSDSLLAPLALPVRPERFSARLESWGRLERGVLEQLTSNVWLSDLQLAVPYQEQQMQLEELGFQLHLQGRPEQFRVQLDNLQLTHNDANFRLGSWQLDWQAGSWQLGGRQLSLEGLQQLALQVPPVNEAATAMRQTLEQFALSGELVALQLEGQKQQVQQTAVHYQRLGLGWPKGQLAVDGLSGWLVLRGGNAWAWLDSRNVLLSLNELFEAPIAVGVRGPLGFERQSQGWRLMAERLALDNHDASASASLVVRAEEGQVPELSLLGRVAEGQVARANRYIPFRKLPDNVANWLRPALLAGDVSSGDFLYEGPVHIDPQRQQDRTFQMLFEVANTRLHFLEHWPTVEDLAGRIVIDGREVRASQLSGNFLGIGLSEAAVTLPQPAPEQPLVLNVQAATEASLDSLTQLFQNTPLRTSLPEELARWAFRDGQLQGEVALSLPLTQPDPAHPLPFGIQARGQLSQGTAHSEARNLELTQLDSGYHFDLQQGLSLDNLQGQFMGYPLHGKAVTRDQRLQFEWDSEVSIPVLRTWLAVDWLDEASGAFAYRASLSVPWGTEASPQLLLRSELHQVQLNLPPPFAKSSSIRTPSELTLRFQPSTTRYEARYGNSVRLQALSGQRGLERLGLQIGGGAARLPSERGIYINGQVGTAEAQRWVDFISDLAQARRGLTATRANAQPFMPWQVNLSIQRLNLWGAEVLGGRLEAEGLPRATSLALESERMAGSLVIPDGYQLRGTEPMIADIRHFHWQPYQTQASSQQWPATNPLSLPVMQVNIGRLTWQQRDMGAWRFELKADEQGLVIQNLESRWRGLNIHGNGLWQHEAGGNARSYFTGQIATENVAAMLRAWDWPVLMESPKASAQLSLNWPGAPYEFDHLALRGEGELKVETGRFPRADNKTSALRLLGVLNMTTVTRRLRLDFSDLYRRGLSFEKFSGNVEFSGPR